MRKIFLGFMSFLILTPVLACGMAFCPMQAAQASDQKPCHQSDDTNKEIMLSLDCMGVDLFQQDPSYDIAPDISTDSTTSLWLDQTTRNNFEPDHINGIRGPPDKTLKSKNLPSILLTTQRFRI